MSHASFLMAEPSIGFWISLDALFVVFITITNGMLAWAAIFRMTLTRWTPAVNRICQSALAFVPVLIVMFVVLMIGLKNWAPWVTEVEPEKRPWLNVPFMVTRDVVVLTALWVLAFSLVRLSLVYDARKAAGLTITDRQHHLLNQVAVATLLTYVVTSTIVSYDFIMALFPKWVSTMFAPYYFSTGVYVGMAVTIIISATRKDPRARDYLGCHQFHDMGNLLLGFSLFNMGLFFAQYLTIWYENLPDEAPFLIVRYLNGQWPPLAWGAFIVAFAIPFIVMQSRAVKFSPVASSIMASMVVLGVVVERYIWIVPSITGRSLWIYGWFVGGVPVLGLLFAGLVWLFLRRYPPISVADEELSERVRPEPVC